MTSQLPRPEYPRPQFVREPWSCLNGEWEFEIDAADTGLERGLLERALSDRITVPFCPESKLSGIGNQDYLNAVWYRRELQIPDDWECDAVLLHFQAVDYDATVWIDGAEVGRHRGGFTPFTIELARGAATSVTSSCGLATPTRSLNRGASRRWNSRGAWPSTAAPRASGRPCGWSP